MSQFGRGFGSATPPAVRHVSFGTYRDSSLPKNEDAYSGFRINKQHQVWLLNYTAVFILHTRCTLLLQFWSMSSHPIVIFLDYQLHSIVLY